MKDRTSLINYVAAFGGVKPSQLGVETCVNLFLVKYEQGCWRQLGGTHYFWLPISNWDNPITRHGIEQFTKQLRKKK